MGHERLAIMGLHSGDQPILDGDYVLAVNGEIYNYTEMSDACPNLKSDCHSIIYFLLKYGLEGLKKLRGMFAFSLFNKNTGEVLIARDSVGIIPLYYG